MECIKYSNDAFALSDFMTSDECAEQIARTERVGFDIAPITTSEGFIVETEARNNTRVMLDDQALAAELWMRCKAYVPARIGGWDACGLNERFRFYRYDRNQIFRWHRDGAFRRTINEESKLTFMVYLNSGFEGGHTSFRGFEVVPADGMSLCFRHPLLHEGAEVTRGTKYVLRTDVMYRRSA
jgi:predicted 2-oxoglutarate/Fe(II)-dependent dioxygenase YbiX